MICFSSKRMAYVTIALGIATTGCVPAESVQSRVDAKATQRIGEVADAPVIDANGAIGRNTTGIVYIPRHRCAGDGKWPVGSCFVEDSTGKPYWYHQDGQWRPVRPRTVTEDIAEPPTN